jgi:hypothetical protein
MPEQLLKRRGRNGAKGGWLIVGFSWFGWLWLAFLAKEI